MKSDMPRCAPLLGLLLVFALGLSGCVRHLISEVDRSDPAIKARLEAEIKAHKELKLSTLEIDVHSRIVTVSGLVDSYEDRATIIRIVNSITGVDQLVLNIVVQD